MGKTGRLRLSCHQIDGRRSHLKCCAAYLCPKSQKPSAVRGLLPSEISVYDFPDIHGMHPHAVIIYSGNIRGYILLYKRRLVDYAAFDGEIGLPEYRVANSCKPRRKTGGF